MKLLTEQELSNWIAEQGEWRLEHGRLIREWIFSDFVRAMTFVNNVAALAEHSQHHPDIEIRYNRVRLGLITHDVGGISDRDVDFATALRGMPTN